MGHALDKMHTYGRHSEGHVLSVLECGTTASAQPLSTNRNQWKFYKSSLENESSLKDIFYNHSLQIVVNLAAQAGVR